PKKLSLSDAIKIAESRGGKYLSKEYINCTESLHWRCSKNHCIESHLWRAILSNVKNRKWCPHCAGNACLTLEDTKKIAFNRMDNVFQRSMLLVNHPYYGSKYLGLPSKIRRPDFLKTLKHPRGLELEILYYDYGFAIKIHGPQHEKYRKFFHKGDLDNFIR
ncbi:8707_t:CDS:2, partial [Scutellospora calospora]